MQGSPLDGENLEETLKKIQGKIKPILMLILILVAGAKSFVVIEAEEVGLITRFGKYSHTIDPGLNFKVPFLDEVYKVSVERQMKEEFGYRTINADEDGRSEYDLVDKESLMLTGDLNLADVTWSVQYKIYDPYYYLFKVRNANETFRDISESVMREIVGDRTVNEVITYGRTEVAIAAKEQMQSVCDEYLLGIKIDQVVLQDVQPPAPVKDAFNEVNIAQQNKETMINNAKMEKSKIIPKAKGEARETIQKAEGYAMERVNKAQGEANRFTALYQEYVKAPEVTRKRIYLETMGRILPKLGNKIITDDKGNNVLPLLQMQMQGAKTLNN